MLDLFLVTNLESLTQCIGIHNRHVIDWTDVNEGAKSVQEDGPKTVSLLCTEGHKTEMARNR